VGDQQRSIPTGDWRARAFDSVPGPEKTLARNADSALASDEPWLFVDLDESLCRTDVLAESLLLLLKTRPWICLRLPLWALRGKAYFKHQIAQRVAPDPKLLPYHAEFLAFLRREHSRGRRLVLATAAHQRWAESVASHLGIFDAVLASTAESNLSGKAKLGAITASCDGEPFDYAGNARVDLTIWRRARSAIVVNARPPVLRAARASAAVAAVFERPRATVALYAATVRVHQWLKNLLLFVPFITAHAWHSPAPWVKLVTAFLAFSLTASALYVLNDALDLSSDRAHPRKRSRPLASGAIPLSHAGLMFTSLIAAGIGAAVLVSPGFLSVLLGYILLTSAYSFYLKSYTLIDVLLLTSLYMLRIIAGSVAIDVVPSFWLMVYSMFTFTSLALLKRFTELRLLKGLDVVAAHGRDYRVSDLGMLANFGTASGYAATLVLALFVNSPDVASRYARPYGLWLLCPLFLYWISRLWLKAERGEMHDDPIVFSVRDRGSRFVIAAMLVSVIASL